MATHFVHAKILLTSGHNQSLVEHPAFRQQLSYLKEKMKYYITQYEELSFS